MVIHLQCTARLLQRLHVRPVERMEPSTSRLGDWHANVIYEGRRPLVITVNDRSLLTVLIPLKETRSLCERWYETVMVELSRLGAPFDVRESEAREMATIQLTRTAGKHAVGCLNEMARHCRGLFEDDVQDPDEALFRVLDNLPVQALGWEAPATVARRLLGVAPKDQDQGYAARRRRDPAFSSLTPSSELTSGQEQPGTEA